MHGGKGRKSRARARQMDVASHSSQVKGNAARMLQAVSQKINAVTGNEWENLSMRHLSALVLCIGLCGVPAVGRAAPAADLASQSAAPGPAPARATQSQRVDAPGAASKARAAGNADDRARYAEREAQSGKALDYRGGDTLVIGTTAAVVILAIVLIVVLL